MHGLIHGIIAAASILCPSQNGSCDKKEGKASFVSNILCRRAHTNKGEEDKGRQTQ
jgi:hypothetical protein